jgi:hypothetical protein
MMQLMINAFAVIGAITVMRFVIREGRWWWKNRNSKPTPWLGLPWGP